MKDKLKPYLSSLPIVDFPNFESHNKNIAVSIPLFYSDMDSNRYSFDFERLKTVHANAAVWSAICIINNTDLVDNGVPIYFHVEDKAHPHVLEMFDKYKIDDNMIRVISTENPKHDENIFDVNYGKKYMCLLDDDDIQPDLWFLVDTDSFLYSSKKIKIYDKLMSPEMQSKPTVYDKWVNGYTLNNYDKWVYGTCMGAGIPFDHSITDKNVLYDLEKESFSRLGLDVDIELAGILPRTCVVSILATLPTSHRICDYIKEHYMNCYQDEFMLAMWDMEHNEIGELRNYLGFQDAFDVKDIYDIESTDSNKDHVLHIRYDECINGNVDKKGFVELYNKLVTSAYEKSNMVPIYSDLKQALKKSTSDKTTVHTYGEIYDMLFNSLYAKLGRPLKICEIGVSRLGPGSLCAFQDIDIVDEIVGIDIDDYNHELNDNTHFYKRDAYTQETIDMLSMKHSQFDLIIDDGSHESNDQLFFMTRYQDLISDGGMIVCEDVVDIKLFKKMCDDFGFIGIDGWANRSYNVNDKHDERLLIKVKDDAETVSDDISDDIDTLPTKLTLHCLSIPYSPTNKKLTACAFVQKVRKFCEMMHKLGHEIIHYGHDKSEVVCTEHVSVTDDLILERAYNDTDFEYVPNFDKEDLCFKVFNINAEREIRKRAKKNDFVLAFFGWGHKELCDNLSDLPVHIVEPSIGYPDSFCDYRVFQSRCKMYLERGKATAVCELNEQYPDNEVTKTFRTWDTIPDWVDDWGGTVIPNFFIPSEFEYKKDKKDYILFIGRVEKFKGIEIALRLAKHTDTKLIVAGPGDLYALDIDIPDFVDFVGIAGLELRKELMSEAKAVICPSLYLEPFLGVHIEAGFCGTPIITTNWGAPMEYCLNGITGYRCQSFKQFVLALENIDKIKPKDCFDWAMNFCVDNISLMYHDYFQTLIRNITAKDLYSIDENYDFNIDYLDYTYSEKKVQSRISEIQNKISEEGG